ncbi:MAG: hypothetical protein ACYT04_90415, partial [Nostoc sp.]
MIKLFSSISPAGKLQKRRKLIIKSVARKLGNAFSLFWLIQGAGKKSIQNLRIQELLPTASFFPMVWNEYLGKRS